MGCDLNSRYVLFYETISIHAARMGCDAQLMNEIGEDVRFQSTQPEWAATSLYVTVLFPVLISIHAARMGCD